MNRLRNRLGLARQTIVAAWWTGRQLVAVRRQFGRVPYDRLRVSPPPPLSPRAGRGVDAVLRLVPATCLQRALVAQRWLQACGVERDVVIGVTGSAGFRAHAWIEGESAPVEYRELTRLHVS
jgi:hypothetical protein